ncbi:ATP synthase F1 subunit gamma [candidate division KSB1 bacterium]|nr:ATP synthase F1 subunit gamma [candidate division KSB1 bacterium]
MATLQQIKRRITSVKGTQKITKAMKMVAAAKLRRAQKNIVQARPYAFKLREVQSEIAVRVSPDMHPLLQKRAPKKVVYLIVTADRGLCGGFNSNIVNRARKIVKEDNFEDYSLMCVGRKGRDFFRTRKYPILEHYTMFFNNLEYAHAQQITDRIIDLYVSEELDRVIMIYNEFKSAIQQNVITEQLLPIEPPAPIAGKELEKGNRTDYLYEPEPLRILDTLLPLHVGIQIWRVLLESSAAEQGARMTAMESATTNAQDMIENLTLYYNSVRQAAITKELLEIIGGAEALK